MTEAKHTPGPWIAITGMASPGWKIYQDVSEGDAVCQCFDKNNSAFLNAGPNARLIAAAPDMLAELRETHGEDGYLLAQIATFIGGLADVSHLSGSARTTAEEYYAKLHALSDRGRAVIAKATGQ